MKRMSSFVRASLLSGSILGAFATQAFAAEPLGEWLVEGGFARIKVDNCNDKLWGVVTWEKKPGGLDFNNPDKAKQKRPTLGMPVLIGMKRTDPKEDTWDGEIYNSQNGKTYSGDISIDKEKPDILRVEGCVMGFLCGGQDWTRVKADPNSTNVSATANPGAPKSPPHTPKMAPKQAAAPNAKPTLPATNAHGVTPPGIDPTSIDVCSMIPADSARK